MTHTEIEPVADTLSLILQRLRLSAGVFVHASYRGAWAVDTSGQRMATFHLIQQGKSWLHMDGAEPRALYPGDLLVLPRDDQHVISSSPEPPATEEVNTAEPVATDEADNLMLCGYFEFQGRAAWPLLDALPDAVIIERNDAQTRQLVELIIAELQTDLAGREATLELFANALFVQMLRAAMRTGWREGLLAAIADPHISKALSAIHAEPAKAWNLETLAQRALLGRTAFAERFRKLTGDTPASYLARWRMQVAVDLLTSTDESMFAIAEQVGYQSEPAFRKAFRREMGKPPGVVRRGWKTAAGA